MIQSVFQPVELFVQEQYSDALQQLEQLLQRQPGNYTALAQLLTLLRRVGRVEEGEAHLHAAQDHVSRTAGTAGRPVEDAPVVPYSNLLMRMRSVHWCVNLT